MLRIPTLLVGVALTSAGIASAQDTDVSKHLVEAFVQSEGCKHNTIKSPLDKNGVPNGPWESPDESDGSALEKLVNGNEKYTRPLHHLSGTVLVKESDHRYINAQLTEELPYGSWVFTYFRLRELFVSLEQIAQGGEWLPRVADITIKYWAGMIGLGINRHDHYHTTFDCSNLP